MTGIQEPDNIEAYVRAVWGEANSCMSPNDRADAVVAHVNEQLAAVGVPPVTWTFDDSEDDGAAFHFGTWQMGLGTHPFAMDVADNATPDQQAWLVDGVYHEARHAEQWFRMARERAGLGATVDQIVAVMKIPHVIAEWAAHAPITQCDASQYEAEEWYRSVYGEGAARRNDTLIHADERYQDYRNLPEEHDAWATGDAVTAQFHHETQQGQQGQHH